MSFNPLHLLKKVSAKLSDGTETTSNNHADKLRLAACVIVKNEGDGILEWGLYHHLIGFDTLIIFDDASTDHTLIEIDKLKTRCNVILEPFARELGNTQIKTYQRVCHLYRDDFDWIAFIDADEFIFSPDSDDFCSFLAQHPQASAIALPWLFFGSSGHEAKPSDLVLTAYTNRSALTDFPPQRHVKTIVRPSKMVSCINPHAFEVEGATLGADANPVCWDDQAGILREYSTYPGWRINHYFTKSAENWAARMARGQLGGEKSKRTLQHFDTYNRNDVKDESALPLAARVKEMIADINAARARSQQVRTDAKVIGICRFSVITGEGTAWQIGKNQSAAQYREAVLDLGRLRSRLQLFQNVTLPSIASQSVAPHCDWFKFTVLVSKLLPAPILTALQAITQQFDWCTVLPVDESGKAFNQVITETVSAFASDSESVITFRIDDDDALAHNYFEVLLPFAMKSHHGQVLTFPGGYKALYDHTAGTMTRAAEHWEPKIALGLAYVSGASDKVQNVFQLKNHMTVDRRHTLISIPSGPMYLRVFHYDNDVLSVVAQSERSAYLQKLFEKDKIVDLEEVRKFFRIKLG